MKNKKDPPKPKLLIVVGMQRDLIFNRQGTPEARKILPHVEDKIMNHVGDQWYVLETHLPNSVSSTFENVDYCVLGTEGHKFVPSIPKLQNFNPSENDIIEVCTFTDTGISIRIEAEGYTDIEIVGVRTDRCVIANAVAIISRSPGVNVTVDANCCAGTSSKAHDIALMAMKMCHVNVINYEECVCNFDLH